MTYPLIDAHLHLFDLVQGDYHWLKEENTPFWPNKNIICQNFNEQDLAVNPPFELGGFIHIEAGFDNIKPWREIAWLESHCQLPFKSVAAINLTLNKNDFIEQVDQLLHYQSVVGCRHILSSIACAVLRRDARGDQDIAEDTQPRRVFAPSQKTQGTGARRGETEGSARYVWRSRFSVWRAGSHRA